MKTTDVHDIWFHLNVGKNGVDEQGKIEQEVLIMGTNQLTAINMESIDKEKRIELHKMLDNTINTLNLEWKYLKERGV